MSLQEATSPMVVEIAQRAPDSLAIAGERAAAALATEISDGFPAGATLLVADADGVLIRATGGWACVVGESVATTRDTLYDLASLTKVVSTVTLALALAERGSWSLDDPVATRLPEYPRADTTLRQLLTHSSGLPDHREFYRLPGGPPAIRRAVYAEATPEIVPGPVCYSDLGFMLLGWALEACSGQPLSTLFRETVAVPLGMERTLFTPPASLRRQTAATELDGDQRLTPGLVWGEVHDGNAWALGGVAGHAGLFAPADDLALFTRALLTPDRHPVLSPASLAEMTRRQAGGPPDTRALGWRLDATEWGPWPERTYWHTGFTGTSLLIAPDLDLSVILLFGGVHPKRQIDRQQELRRAVHHELAASFA
jgi:CubicO group peptidase (beta-lactamase class C family)